MTRRAKRERERDAMDPVLILLLALFGFMLIGAIVAVETRDGLGDLVDNLVSNAIRYTPVGGAVVIRVGTVAGQARLEVADNGIGIPFDELPHIFEEFFRGQEAKKAVAHGTGLGMAIVKRVADVHLGKIDVQSERGKGTTFVVTFPAAVSAETPVSA